MCLASFMDSGAIISWHTMSLTEGGTWSPEPGVEGFCCAVRDAAGWDFASNGLLSLSLSGLGGHTALIAPPFTLSSSPAAPCFSKGPLDVFLSLEPPSEGFEGRA